MTGRRMNIPVVLVKVKDIVRCRWRDEDDSPEKVAKACERIGRQGWRGHLDGLPLPDGKVEQLNGHNRVTACKQLGVTEIPFSLKARTLEEARDILLSDNLKEDGQSTGWALGAIRKLIPELLQEGKTLFAARAILSSASGLEMQDIAALSNINDALEKGTLSPEIKRIPAPRNAVQFYKKMQELQTHRTVSMTEQKAFVDRVVANRDTRTAIRNYFHISISALRPEKVRLETPKKTTFAAVSLLVERATSTLQEHIDDLTEHEHAVLRDKFQYALRLFPLTEPQELDEVDLFLTSENGGLDVAEVG